MKKIFVFNGPNLNQLGRREPLIYGSETLEEIDHRLQKEGKAMGYDVIGFQSNCEGALIDAIHNARSKAQFILMNAGALAHTSISLRDALLSVAIPFIEVHLSNTQAREPFRHTSYLSDIALGIVMGFGAYSYCLALLAADHYLKKQPLSE